jgi:hypothetical protein
MQPIAWFAGFAVTDGIGQDYKIFGGVKQLPGPEKMPTELSSQEIVPITGRAVHDKDGICHLPLLVPGWFAKGCIMNIQLAEGRLAALERETNDLEISFCLIGKCRRGRLGSEGEAESYKLQAASQ